MKARMGQPARSILGDCEHDTSIEEIRHPLGPVPDL